MFCHAGVISVGKSNFALVYYILASALVIVSPPLIFLYISFTFTVTSCVCTALNAAQQLAAVSLSTRVNARKHGNSQQAF